LFLAGLHGIDPNIRRALRTEGVPRWRADLHVTIPMLRPYVVTSVLLLSFVVARTFDLVVAMTGGGPGFATDLPTLLIYDLMFPRSRAGTSAACAVVLMVTMTAVLAPYVAIEMRRRRA
jgi:glucose/mannose transport system permease protein